MDNKYIMIIGCSLILSQIVNANLNATTAYLATEENRSEVEALPNADTNLATFESKEYKIKFKYPMEWKKNPRYSNKYEGATGFFEVGDFSGSNEDIDQAVQTQIDEYYKPYGDNPKVVKAVIDGEPARIIYASDSQSEFYKDRGVAVVVKYPEPIELDGETFKYVVIWVSDSYVPLIKDTLEFVGFNKA